MNKNPDYEVLLRTRENIELSRNGTEYVLRIGDAPYSISFLISKDNVNEMIEKKLDKLRDSIEELMEEERDYLDNIPENLQGSMRYEDAESNVDDLDSSLDSLDDVISYITDAVGR